jgi:uncharacterized protein
MAVLDEEIEWHEPDVNVPWRGIHRGHDGVVSWLHIIGRELADLVVQPHEFIATNETVVVLGHESARVTAIGRAYHSDFTLGFRVRNGKLTAFRAYHDTDAMMRATADRQRDTEQTGE